MLLRRQNRKMPDELVGSIHMNIKTTRLSIKPYETDDMEALIGILSNEVVKETFMVPDLRGQEEQEKMFRKLKNDSESELHYAGGIYLTDTLIGLILDVEVNGNSVEVGYALHPQYHNCGYATEALQGIIMYLFQNGIKEVVAGAFEYNLSSIRVMKKCGMEQIDKQEEIDYRGKKHHCVYYSIKKSN